MPRNSLCLVAFLLPVLASAQPAKPADEGTLPLGADGKPLNLDFETGTLKDWTAEGDAFKGQPIKGDTVFPRRNDNKSHHQGEYWIGGYEKLGDKPQGRSPACRSKSPIPGPRSWSAAGRTIRNLRGTGPQRYEQGFLSRLRPGRGKSSPGRWSI